jgi:hypothetical protein
MQVSGVMLILAKSGVGEIYCSKRNRLYFRQEGILVTLCKLTLTILLLLNLAVFCPRLGESQSAATASVPAEISADLGICFAFISVTGIDLKPIYGAKITTRVRYGLMGVKRLDLEAYTDANGQVKITNLPEILKKPMYIYINKGEMQEIVEFKPDVRCRATFNVQLR